MKKAIFSMLLLSGNLLTFDATAQVSVSVRMGAPVYCPPPPPVRVVVVSPPAPARMVVIKPAPVIVRPVVVVRPAPPPSVRIIARPRRSVVICR